MRAIWTGSINFGMVAIPVKVGAATEPAEGVAFRQVRKSDGSRIQQKRFAVADDTEVPYSEIGKALEYGEDLIPFTDDDLAELPVPALKRIDVTQFCSAKEVDPMLRSKDYWVEPANPAATKAYTLLWYALADGNKAAIGKVALRQREHLCMLTVRDGNLALTTLLWPEEVREAPAVALDAVSNQEQKLAASLVSALTAPFDGSQHTDAYKAAVYAVAERKVAGGEVPVTPAPEATGGEQAVSLVELLQASVKAATEDKK